MIRKWLKQFLPASESITNHEHISWLGKAIHHPNLWHLSRRSVARGAFVGLLAAFIPLPIQMLVAALLAILVRGNLPVAVVATWISNPITFIPLNFFIFKVGEFILGESQDLYTVSGFEWHASWDELWEVVINWSKSLGKPFLVGLPVVAILTAILGFLVINLIWKLAVYLQWQERKRKLQKSSDL